MPRTPNQTRREQVGFRLPVAMIAFLDEMAVAEDRDRTKQLVAIIREAAKRRGYDLEAKAVELAEPR